MIFWLTVLVSAFLAPLIFLIKKTTFGAFWEAKTWQGIALGVIVGSAFALGGFFLIHDHQNMGIALFILLPIATGFAIGLVTQTPELQAGSTILTLLIVTSILIKTGFEGSVCCLLSAPLLACCIAFGAILGNYFQEKIKGSKAGLVKFIILGLVPFGLMGAREAEKPMFRSPRTECVTTTFIVPESIQAAWNKIKSVDRLEGQKPFLLKIGLPTPQRCELRKEAVGSERICYFNAGAIEEIFTEWKPPTSMKLKITKVSLPGRDWLGYQDASYEFQAEGNSTKITRKTTVTSFLYPVWYWRPLEHWGVQSEHLYLFKSLFKKVVILPEVKS